MLHKRQIKIFKNFLFSQTLLSCFFSSFVILALSAINCLYILFSEAMDLAKYHVVNVENSRKKNEFWITVQVKYVTTN